MYLMPTVQLCRHIWVDVSDADGSVLCRHIWVDVSDADGSAVSTHLG